MLTAHTLSILLIALALVACQSELNIHVKRAELAQANGTDTTGDAGNTGGDQKTQDMAPVFSFGNGTYTEGDLISITVTDPDVTIHYTTDGTTPTPDSPIYTGDIPLEESTTIKAIAVKDGESVSDVVEVQVTVKAKPLTSTVTSGTYATAQNVDLTSGSSGATIYYTLDGSAPTTSSNVYTTPIYINSTTTVKAIAVKPGLENSDVLTIDLIITQPAVAAPTFSLATGTYKGEQTGIILSTSTPGAVIHYTTDGSTPDTSDPQYSLALTVSKNTTIKAVAIASGYLDSSVTTASYTIKVEDVTSDVAAGTYATTQLVALSTDTSGAAIHYTLDGSAPTTSSPTFSSAITVASTTRIRAIAVKTGLSNSDALDITITISGGGGGSTVADPTFSLPAGTYTNTISVKLATTTAGATIYYTTDGSAPDATDTKYTNEIPVSSTTTIKAIGIKSGDTDSAIVTQTFTIQAGSWNTDGIMGSGLMMDEPWDIDTAMNDIGDVAVVWLQTDGTVNRVYFAERVGGVWPGSAASPISVSSSNALEPKVAINNSGDIVITWIQSNGTYNMMYKATRTAGVWTYPANINDHISPTGDHVNYSGLLPKNVAIDDNGDAIIIWGQQTVAGGETKIFRSERRSGTWTNPADLTQYISVGTATGDKFAVAMNNNGYALVVYLAANSTGGYSVFKSEYIGGTWVEPSSNADTFSENTTTYSILSLTAAANDNGEAIIAWGDTFGQVRARERRTGSWGTSSIFFGPMDPSYNVSSHLSADMDANGDTLISWALADDGANILPRMLKSHYINGIWNHPADEDDYFYESIGYAQPISNAHIASGQALIVWNNILGTSYRMDYNGSWGSSTSFSANAMPGSAMNTFGASVIIYGEPDWLTILEYE